MEIQCPKCNRSFKIDKSLIPEKGRLLQCGTCGHKWFFKNIIHETKTKTVNINEENILKKPEITKKIQNPKININEDEYNKTKIKGDIRKKNVNKINYIKFFFVIIISIVALILILDTFKDILIKIFPNIKILLNNLYETLKDISLFFYDLVS
ncbi:zinc-ribbon domain-containing protein [Candidatus Pelagibacter sp.]|nr:zinc-ribbon domain-containing protein [Candidatus Pelagibacter sp.]